MNFAEDSFNVFAHFIRAHAALSVQQFLIKHSMTSRPHPPYSPISPQVTFFVSLDEKVLKGKHFAEVEEVKQKMAEALKGIKINEFKNCFGQWKKVLKGVLHHMGRTLKVTEV